MSTISLPRLTRIRHGTPQPALSVFFLTVTSFVDEALKTGGSVLVHCMAGVSRSSSIVIAYLMRYRRVTFLEAFEMVRQQRPVIAPNRGFKEQLMVWEKFLEKYDEGKNEDLSTIKKEDRFTEEWFVIRHHPKEGTMYLSGVPILDIIEDLRFYVEENSKKLYRKISILRKCNIPFAPICCTLGC